jgi:hypothetical protein
MQSFELDKNDIQRIKQALEADDEALKALLSEYHASEIAKPLLRKPASGSSTFFRSRSLRK